MSTWAAVERLQRALAKRGVPTDPKHGRCYARDGSVSVRGPRHAPFTARYSDFDVHSAQSPAVPVPAGHKIVTVTMTASHQYRIVKAGQGVTNRAADAVVEMLSQSPWRNVRPASRSVGRHSAGSSAWVIRCGPEVGPRDEGLYHRRRGDEACGYTSDLAHAGVWDEAAARSIAGLRDGVHRLADVLAEGGPGSAGAHLGRGYCDICDWPLWEPSAHKCPGPHQDRGRP